MQSEPPANPDGSESLRVDEAVACDECGRFGALHVGERRLCSDCYESAGSCCPEFGKDDLWVFRDNV
jgi:hypothetical protein